MRPAESHKEGVRAGYKGRRARAGASRGCAGREVAVQAACRGEGGDYRFGGRRARGEAAHVKHVAHARDAGGVPAERLVEGRRALPRGRKHRAHGAGRAAGWEAARGEQLRCARSMQGEGRV